jgi:anti-sigma-K factor RskA
MVTDEQITLYAIGAMDAQEAAEFERQLASSPELRARVAEEEAAVAALLTSVEPVAPPPVLKQKLMARIDEEVATEAPADAIRTVARAGLGDIWRYLLGGLSAALAALALVFGIGLANSQSQVAQLQANAQDVAAQLQQANARVAELERDLAQAQSQIEQAHNQLELSQQAAKTAQGDVEKARADLTSAQTDAAKVQNELAAAMRELTVLNQPEVRLASLPANKDEFESGAVKVFFSPQSNQALITLSNLPPLGANQTYQLWLIKGNTLLPSSVFNTGTDGTGRLVVESDELFSEFDRIGVTVEPAGGRSTPSPEGPIFLGPLG